MKIGDLVKLNIDEWLKYQHHPGNRWFYRELIPKISGLGIIISRGNVWTGGEQTIVYFSESSYCERFDAGQWALEVVNENR